MACFWKRARRASPLRRLCGLFAVGLVVASVASAGRGLHPIDYHATLINGPVTGSSFLIAEGLAVTNRHVLNGARPGDRVALSARGRGGRETATVLAVSPRMDLALLEVRGGWMPVVPAAGGRSRPGSRVVAAGVEAERGRPRRRLELAGTVTSSPRRIDAYGRGIVARIPGVRRGFSGGPVIDARGELVGMLTALRPAAGSNDVGNEAFVLLADEIRREADKLMRAR